LHSEDALPDHMPLGGGATETLNLDDLFPKDITETGSFDLGAGIWAGTFGKVIQATPIPVLLIDQDLNVVVANQAWRKVSAGYESMQGKPFARLTPNPSEALEGETVIRNVFSTRRTATCEVLLELDGNRIWGRLTFRPIKIKEQRFLLVLIEDLTLEKKQLLQDKKHKEELEKRVQERTEELRSINEKLLLEIAYRTRSEQALRESEERYRLLVENIEDLICTHDLHGTVLFANAASARLLGYDPGELVGSNMRSYVAPEMEERFDAYLDDIGREGRAAGLMLVRTAGGEKRFWEYRNTLIRTEGADPVVLGVARDVTASKRAELALQENERRFRALFEQAAAGVAQIKTETGRFVLINRRYADILGYTPEEMQAFTFHEIIHPDDLEAVLINMTKLKQGAIREFSAEIRHFHRNGSVVWVNLAVSPMWPPGSRPDFHIAVVEDITERKLVETMLRDAEKKYRRLFEKAPLMYVITRNQYGEPFIHDCNDFFLKAVGYSRDQVVGRPFKDFYSPESVDALLRGGGYARALAGEFFIGERELTTREGRLIPTLLYTATETDSLGRVIGTRAMFVDITERKKMEQALRESEERFRAVFDSRHAVMLIIDPETGKIEDASPGACAFYGCDRETMRVKKVSEINILSPEQIYERMQSAKSEQHRYFDFQHRLAHGEIRDVEVCTGPIAVGGRSLLFSIVNDVTDRKRAEAALSRSEAKYRALFDESKDGVYSVLRDGEITDANPSLLETFGFTREEIIGKDIHELYVDPRDRRKFQEEIEKKGFVKDYEVAFRRMDGTPIPCMLTSSVQYGDDGLIIGYRGIMRDLTIRKRLQAQLIQAQKMEAVGTLAGGVAHDFNNILQVALGYSDFVLSDEDFPERYRSDVRKINEAAKRGSGLVQSLLTFSRRTEVKSHPLDLNRRIRDMREMLERTIPKMIEIRLSLAEDLAAINADPTQTDQVLMNLAVNARDAMPEKGILTIQTENVTLDEVYAESHLDAKPGRYVLLTVTDTGTGMPPEVLEHIFEPFYTTKCVGRGTGLGLAMVHGIVQRHGGRIECRSEPGRGTSFRIYFPAVASSEDLKNRPGPSPWKGGSETVLLVDDEESIREIGSRILKRAGYGVIVAADGRRALQVFLEKRNEISLVILDLMMPEMGGRQCLEQLLALEPSLKVVIASGAFMEGIGNEGRPVGAKGFINKPYDLRQFLGVVRAVL
ncbi:MAG: PAS domain S-box protein, partial [Pseudomonadota bacterium]